MKYDGSIGMIDHRGDSVSVDDDACMAFQRRGSRRGSFSEKHPRYLEPVAARPFINRGRGFALVSTLLLMVVISVIAVGMLSLSTVTLRNSMIGGTQERARANARMALMIAIGDLQKLTGPDTRITAPADIVQSDAPHLLGAWKSWEGTDHEVSGSFIGRPIQPDYDLKKEAETSSQGRFLQWLVSGATYGDKPTDPAAFVSKIASIDTVPMLSSGTLKPGDDREVHIKPQLVTKSDAVDGAFAWWVSGENQKAFLPNPRNPQNDTAAGWADVAMSHAVVDPKPFELDNLLGDAVMSAAVSPADKAITLRSADLMAKSITANPSTQPQQHFHDLSVNAVGLLTNSATGGWRKDLSVLSEKWNAATTGATGAIADLPSNDLPMFRLSSEYGTTQVGRPTSSNIYGQQSIFYPWSEYNTTASSLNAENGAVVSWGRVFDYLNSYKKITYSGGNPSIPYLAPSVLDKASANAYDFYHKQMISPVIARIHWLFSHRTIRIPNGPGPADDTFRLDLLVTPVITMWNPFNVSIATPAGLRIRTARALPCALQHYNKDGNPLGYKRLVRGATFDDNVNNQYPRLLNNSQSWFDLLIDSAFTLEPGESRVFSPTLGQTTPITGSNNKNMKPGYRLEGFRYDNITTLDPVDPVWLDLNFDTAWKEVTTSSNNGTVGMYLDVFKECMNAGQALSNKHVTIYRQSFTRAVANTYWPPISHTSIASPQAQEIENVWRPVFSVVYGPRISGPTSTGLPGKGVMQTNPATGYARQTRDTSGYMGAKHPINATADFSFFLHTGNDDRLPNAQNSSPYAGYIISGLSAADGLSRLSIAHLPLRPIASLADLQNLDLKAQNGVPPYQINIIGNSDASPLLPANNVINPGLTDVKTASPLNYNYNLQHDDSYCANHLLFDDWFFSSIAPVPASFGSTQAKSMETLYKEYLNGTATLTNRAYRPIMEDRQPTTADAQKLYDDLISPDGWQRTASRFEVEGMFNVNSTSIKAWRALLGHAREQKIPYFNASGIITSEKVDYALSRSSVAADAKAGGPGISGGFPESTEFSGYRVFTDAMLDDLAVKVVEQVRLRGPFLSLSEFVNRQLGSGDFALAGAIQTALNQMAGEPNKTLKQLSQATVKDPAGNDEYQYRDAAEGYSSYGLPGWIRQADVLRPIAPILSVRDDTFTIRAYGDARDATGKVVARAWCEATVRRSRNYINGQDPADCIDPPQQPENLNFGRRYELISFRWLQPAEV